MEIIAIIASIMGLSALGTAFKFVRDMDMSDTKKKRVVNKKGIKVSRSQKDVRCVNCVNTSNKGSVLTVVLVEGNLDNLDNLDSEGEAKLQDAVEKFAKEVSETIKR
ncbi:hypothetical protein H6G93_13680 [Nostoc sp. FACHB-973]|nr:hypothetical protein [Nostoc sp. FACHB-973]MBX9258432.1 hypothetical protein [Desmonostoc muscorum CCALA 125]